MTISVEIHVSGHPDRILGVTAESQEAVRFTFNPSLNENVTLLKALAAAFLTVADTVVAENKEAAREIAVAKTNLQTASMWAVLGATKEL